MIEETYFGQRFTEYIKCYLRINE